MLDSLTREIFHPIAKKCDLFLLKIQKSCDITKYTIKIIIFSNFHETFPKFLYGFSDSWGA